MFCADPNPELPTLPLERVEEVGVPASNSVRAANGGGMAQPFSADSGLLGPRDPPEYCEFVRGERPAFMGEPVATAGSMSSGPLFRTLFTRGGLTTRGVRVGSGKESSSCWMSSHFLGTSTIPVGCSPYELKCTGQGTPAPACQQYAPSSVLGLACDEARHSRDSELNGTVLRRVHNALGDEP